MAIIANDFTLAYFNLSFDLTDARLTNKTIENVETPQELASSTDATSNAMSVNDLEKEWTTMETNTTWDL